MKRAKSPLHTHKEEDIISSIINKMFYCSCSNDSVTSPLLLQAVRNKYTLSSAVKGNVLKFSM
jgi:hypothetical protein